MAARHDNLQRISDVAGWFCRCLAATVSGIAFWTAIVVPVSYLLFMVRGIDTRSQLTTLLALVAVNYLALILGRSHYDRPEP